MPLPIVEIVMRRRAGLMPSPTRSVPDPDRATSSAARVKTTTQLSGYYNYGYFARGFNGYGFYGARKQTTITPAPDPTRATTNPGVGADL